MSSLDLVIPEGFLFILSNLLFISSCFFISYIISKIVKSKIVFFVLFFSLLNVMYYDLFIKYTVKNYYELTQMDSKIYANVEKNTQNKIDSLSMLGVYVYPLKYSTSLTEQEKEEIRAVHEQYVNKFIDISTYAYKYNRYVYNTERIYLNEYKYQNNDYSEKPRFTISKKLVETFFPNVFGKYEYKFVDEKTGVVVATAFNVFFINKYDKARNKYLYWTQTKEDEFNLTPVQNFDIIYKRIFIDNIK